ncbi:MAG: hypothetical protein ABSG63_17000 [Spirochaetia bacterium]|jgi:signal transduction histidine kinase
MQEQETNGGWSGEDAGWAAAYAAITAELAFEPDEGRGARARQRLTLTKPMAAVKPRVSVNRVIESALPLLHCSVGPRIEVAVDLAPGPLSITARAPRIEQLVLALARAAREAMPDGGRLTLCTRSLRYKAVHASRAAGSYVVLCMADTGPAASEEERALISPLADLLLASARGIVEECGGRMQVSGTVRGTEYRIHFSAGETA